MKKIFLTSGDIDGIGLEVTAKALASVGPQRGIQFILFRSNFKAKRWLKIIDTVFDRVTINSLNENNDKKLSYLKLIDICSEEAPPFWFKEALLFCLHSPTSSIVTGPISKPLFLSSNLNVIGHTGLLKKLCKTDELYMAFLGSKFNVLLATDHIPLQKVANKLKSLNFSNLILLASSLRASLTPGVSNKPIGFVGLNPHAGDDELIGSNETQLLEPLIKKFNTIKTPIRGPLVPDAAFLPSSWKKYSLFVCMYHDQGLIPFKTVHGQDSGIHITLGLPFVRASVDHGTAKDLFNKNKANPASMIEAIKYTVRATTRKKV